MRTACRTGDFSKLKVEGADDVLAAVDQGSEPEEVCNALLIRLCGMGEPLIFETGLPELVSWLRRRPRGEEPSDILGEGLGARPNVEKWFDRTSGLVGLLTATQTQELAAAFAYFRKDSGPPARLRGLAAMTRRFTPVEPAAEHLDELIALVEHAAAQNHGLAVLRED